MELFADHRIQKEDVPVDAEQKLSRPWKVLLVDDDEQMHQVTKLALSGFEFPGAWIGADIGLFGRGRKKNN